jgi:hypothetical protein
MPRSRWNSAVSTRRSSSLVSSMSPWTGSRRMLTAATVAPSAAGGKKSGDRTWLQVRSPHHTTKPHEVRATLTRAARLHTTSPARCGRRRCACAARLQRMVRPHRRGGGSRAGTSFTGDAIGATGGRWRSSREGPAPSAERASGALAAPPARSDRSRRRRPACARRQRRHRRACVSTNAKRPACGSDSRNDWSAASSSRTPPERSHSAVQATPAAGGASVNCGSPPSHTGSTSTPPQRASPSDRSRPAATGQRASTRTVAGSPGTPEQERPVVRRDGTGSRAARGAAAAGAASCHRRASASPAIANNARAGERAPIGVDDASRSGSPRTPIGTLARARSPFSTTSTPSGERRFRMAPPARRPRTARGRPAIVARPAASSATPPSAACSQNGHCASSVATAPRGTTNARAVVIARAKPATCTSIVHRPSASCTSSTGGGSGRRRACASTARGPRPARRTARRAPPSPPSSNSPLASVSPRGADPSAPYSPHQTRASRSGMPSAPRTVPRTASAPATS